MAQSRPLVIVYFVAKCLVVDQCWVFTQKIKRNAGVFISVQLMRFYALFLMGAFNILLLLCKVLPPVPYQKSFRTATRSPKHNFDFSFL
jgi:hypothetical protein